MEKLNALMQAQFDLMCATGKLFRADISGERLWNAYLQGFGQDPIFRDPESSVHNCTLCNNFMRRYGNIVAISETYGIMSIFDVTLPPGDEYENTCKELSAIIHSCTISNVFFETFNELNSLPYESINKTTAVFQLNIAKNHKRYTKEEAEKFGVVKPDEIRSFNHLNLRLPKAFVSFTGDSIESIMGKQRDNVTVFKRAMEEIPMDTLELVRDLINQGSLLDGATHLHKLEQIIPMKREYDSLSAAARENWCWVTASTLPYAKFKNELIGVLCSELAEGKEINDACKAWNYRVDPANYMKAVAPFTENQKKMAIKVVEEGGFTESFDRRLATIDDIKATEIKHVNVSTDAVKNATMFDGLKASKSTRHKRNEFDGIEEVSIDKFMKDILPGCTMVEAFLQNNHQNKMVTLTTANNPDSKPMFKWGNNYSWTFNGNLAGASQIKEAVKGQGGKVDGVLRFSIMWAEDDTDNSDLDAHCIEPDRNVIYYSSKHSYSTGGNLDIDITQPQSHKRQYNKEVVENITYPSLQKMNDGTYKFLVNQFSARGSKGFKAEIEFNGELYSYTYDRPVSGRIPVADVTLRNGEFTIEHHLPECGVSSRELYGLETQTFHKVNLISLSPNHWNGESVGNKHIFFMLEGCKTPTSIRGFHAENLVPELYDQRKVLEPLGALNMIAPEGKQLSGIGFNATVHDELILKLSGSFKRTIKVKF